MKCSCPKCSALLSEDLSAAPEKGKSGKCPECGGSYWIHRESFMLRCYAVTGVRYCSKCGGELGQSTYCPGCGTLYPDYCVVHSKKPAQRAFEKKHFTLNIAFPSSAGRSATTGKTEGLTAAVGKAGGSDLRRQLMMVGAGLALLAVLGVIAFLYMQDRAETKFSKRFVAVLYGIKSGTDGCLKMSALLANGTPLENKDLVLLKSVKAENAAALQLLTPPPEKFSDAHSSLVKLAATSEKLMNLCITSKSSAEIASSAAVLEKQFYKQAKDLKGVLHPKLLAELKEKASRFNLQFMLE